MSPEPTTEITLREVYDAVLELKGELAGTPSIIADHETRIRKLEALVWKAAGAAMVIGAALGWLVPLLLA